MTSRQIAPAGGPIDVCWHHGRICVAWQDGPGPDARLVYQEIDAAQPTRIAPTRIAPTRIAPTPL